MGSQLMRLVNPQTNEYEVVGAVAYGGGGGSGDMLKSTYDSNNDGKISYNDLSDQPVSTTTEIINGTTIFSSTVGEGTLSELDDSGSYYVATFSNIINLREGLLYNVIIGDKTYLTKAIADQNNNTIELLNIAEDSVGTLVFASNTDTMFKLFKQDITTDNVVNNNTTISISSIATIIDNETLTFENGMFSEIFFDIHLDINDIFNVIYDGVSYNDLAVNFFTVYTYSIFLIGNTTVCSEAGATPTIVNTDLPFSIMIEKAGDQFAMMILSVSDKASSVATSTHTVSLTKSVQTLRTIKELDLMYIPDSIKSSIEELTENMECSTKEFISVDVGDYTTDSDIADAEFKYITLDSDNINDVVLHTFASTNITTLSEFYGIFSVPCNYFYYDGLKYMSCGEQGYVYRALVDPYKYIFVDVTTDSGNVTGVYVKFFQSGNTLLKSSIFTVTNGTPEVIQPNYDCHMNIPHGFTLKNLFDIYSSDIDFTGIVSDLSLCYTFDEIYKYDSHTVSDSALASITFKSPDHTLTFTKNQDNTFNRTCEVAVNISPKIIASTTDLTAGTSPLATGTLYFVYE